METRTITPEQKEALDRRLPDEAVSQHPTKKFLSSIKSIYVTERLNEVFGVGSWRVETDIVERAERMVVVKLRFRSLNTVSTTNVLEAMTMSIWATPAKGRPRMR